MNKCNNDIVMKNREIEGSPWPAVVAQMLRCFNSTGIVEFTAGTPTEG
jgi:hypothetical protein